MNYGTWQGGQLDQGHEVVGSPMQFSLTHPYPVLN